MPYVRWPDPAGGWYVEEVQGGPADVESRLLAAASEGQPCRLRSYGQLEVQVAEPDKAEVHRKRPADGHRWDEG